MSLFRTLAAMKILQLQAPGSPSQKFSDIVNVRKLTTNSALIARRGPRVFSEEGGPNGV